METIKEQPQKTSHLKLRLFVLFVLFPLALFVGYTWLTLHFVYSSGERAGYLQKFSKRGWVFKTWEGELSIVSLPGAMPEIFHFTVSDDNIASEVEKLIGKRAVVSYEQHRGIPFRVFGDTQYFLQSVKEAESQTPFQVNLSPQSGPVGQK